MDDLVVSLDSFLTMPARYVNEALRRKVIVTHGDLRLAFCQEGGVPRLANEMTGDEIADLLQAHPT